MASKILVLAALNAKKWFLENHLPEIDGYQHPRITIAIIKPQGCQGLCEKINNRYKITVNPSQPLRDFIATVMHEPVHVKQWEEDYKGDAEKQCSELEYKLTDQAWAKGIF